MGGTVIERRVEERVVNCGRIARATLRPGCPVMVVDVSANGALIEAGRPLRPGARVHLHLATQEHALTVAAVVLRCSVWSIGQGVGEGVLYRGALQFERRWEGLAIAPDALPTPPVIADDAAVIVTDASCDSTSLAYNHGAGRR